MDRQVAVARWLKVTVSAVMVTTLAVAAVSAIVSYEFATPIFKFAVAPDRSLLVADAGAGDRRAPK